MAIAQLAAYDEFIEFFTSNPTLEQISEFRLSDASDAHINRLLEANRLGRLDPRDKDELDEYIRLEHLMRKAKLRAFEKLAGKA